MGGEQTRRVFVTGASGFVGSAIVEELVARGFGVNALSHRQPLRVESDAVRSIRGSMFDLAALNEGMRDCVAVIHLVGIIMEKPSRRITFERMHIDGTASVVDAARQNGIRRYIHMSALGSRPVAASRYHQTKFIAEEVVRAKEDADLGGDDGGADHDGGEDAGGEYDMEDDGADDGGGPDPVGELDWTIFRPSLIHGPGGEFMQMEAKWTRFAAPPFLFMPYFGAGLFGFGGAGKLQPIYVQDVAHAFVDAISNRRSIGEIYPLGGPNQITWPQLHRIASTAIRGRARATFPIPAWSAKLQAALIPNSILGFNRDQVIMSQEDNTCDITKFVTDFGWEPRPFEATLKDYARRL